MGSEPYGYELILDLFGCDVSLFTRSDMRRFFKELCELIGMKRSKLVFWDFDSDDAERDAAPEYLAGASAVQFLEQSNITIHTLDKLEAVYLNIFACGFFDCALAEKFTAEWFKSRRHESRFIERKSPNQPAKAPQLSERSLLLPPLEKNKEMIPFFSVMVANSLGKGEIPIKFAVTKSGKKGFACELGVLSGINIGPSIFEFRKRNTVTTDDFNVALIIPTGVGAEIGGHAGDAGSVTKLLALLCDHLITHPNVVNASDINELPENGLYVEGSILAKFMMGTVALQPVRKNRVLVVVENHPDKRLVDAAVNSVNAARVSYGFECPGIVLTDHLGMRSEYCSSGRAVGEVRDLSALFHILYRYQGQYDAVAITSVIEISEELRDAYYTSPGDIVNPWGGVEAMLTHVISLRYNIPAAHAPMEFLSDDQNKDYGVVDPRVAAEMVSITYLNCVLKGLMRAPRIVRQAGKGTLTVNDVSALVIPDGCIGLPVLAALEHGIPVVAVRENKTIMKNDLKSLPWGSEQFYLVDNYWEAHGVLTAIKAGIVPESVRRPMGCVECENDGT